jgi:hypothetical protein
MPEIIQEAKKEAGLNAWNLNTPTS